MRQVNPLDWLSARIHVLRQHLNPLDAADRALYHATLFALSVIDAGLRLLGR